MLGGMVLVLALELSSFLFPHFSDLVSLSQSRRAAGFVPFAFALAGGAAVLARALRLLVLPVALAAGIVLAAASTPATSGCATRTAARRSSRGSRSGAASPASSRRSCSRGAAAGRSSGRASSPGSPSRSSCCPSPCTASRTGTPGSQRDANALTPGLVAVPADDVPERSVVFADLETSYRISAYAPVYVANAPPTHVADTKANDPDRPPRGVARVPAGRSNLAIPRHYGAGWLVLRGAERVGPGPRLVYRDGRFRVYRL